MQNNITTTKDKILKLIKEIENQSTIPYEALSPSYQLRMSKKEHEMTLDYLLNFLHSKDAGHIGSQRRLFKSSELPRCVHIVLDENDNYIAILETKGKKAGGLKFDNHQDFVQKGSYKVCKNSFQLKIYKNQLHH